MEVSFAIGFINKVVAIFFGSADGLLYALIVLVVLDYITGVCVAVQNKKLSSDIGAKGIAKKVMIFVLVSLSHVVDEYLVQADALRILTTAFYMANEGISILENAKAMGIPLPEKLITCIASIERKIKKK